MKGKWIVVSALSFACCLAFGHPGRTDANGGHYNRKTGEYHYHRAPRQTTQQPVYPAGSYTPATNTTQNIEKAYWLNTSTGVRHNRACRWFGNTKNGRYCRPDEGRPCAQCGG